MENVRILDVVTTDIAAYRFLRSRVKKINDHIGFENAICCPKGSYFDSLQREGIPLIEIEMKRKVDPFSLRSEVTSLREAMRFFQPQIVHSHSSKAGILARMAGKLENVPVVIHQVHGFHFSSSKGVKKFFYRWVEKKGSKYADYLFFQNREEYDFARTAGWDAWTHLVYIGNGISFEEFSPALLEKKLEKKKTPRILCIARVEPVKNQILLVEALKLLKKEVPQLSFRCDFLGEADPKIKNFLEEEARKGGISNRLFFHGRVSRETLMRFLSNADISVLTSLKEGKPRALMESSFMGVPVVATDVVGTREVVFPDENGFLVPLGNPKELAAKIQLLLSEKDLSRKLGERGRQIAREKFDENRIIGKILSIYRESMAKYYGRAILEKETNDFIED